MPSPEISTRPRPSPPFSRLLSRVLLRIPPRSPAPTDREHADRLCDGVHRHRPGAAISRDLHPAATFSSLLTPSHAFSHAPSVIGQVQIVGIFSELTASTGSYASVVSGITSAFLLDPTMVDIECLVPPALMDFSAAGSDGLNPQTSAQLGILAVPVVTFVGLLIAQAVCACMGKPTAYDKCARLMLIFFMLQVLDLPSPPPLLHIRRPPS